MIGESPLRSWRPNWSLNVPPNHRNCLSCILLFSPYSTHTKLSLIMMNHKVIMSSIFRWQWERACVYEKIECGCLELKDCKTSRKYCLHLFLIDELDHSHKQIRCRPQLSFDLRFVDTEENGNEVLAEIAFTNIAYVLENSSHATVTKVLLDNFTVWSLNIHFETKFFWSLIVLSNWLGSDLQIQCP